MKLIQKTVISFNIGMFVHSKMSTEKKLQESLTARSVLRSQSQTV